MRVHTHTVNTVTGQRLEHEFVLQLGVPPTRQSNVSDLSYTLYRSGHFKMSQIRAR